MSKIDEPKIAIKREQSSLLELSSVSDLSHAELSLLKLCRGEDDLRAKPKERVFRLSGCCACMLRSRAQA